MADLTDEQRASVLAQVAARRAANEALTAGQDDVPVLDLLRERLDVQVARRAGRRGQLDLSGGGGQP